MSTIDELLQRTQADLESSLRMTRKLRHPWRDYRGLVHIIRPVVEVSSNGEPYVAHWVYVCGLHTLSRGLRIREPDAIVTCLSCLGEPE
jgi:hypothetical protein